MIEKISFENYKSFKELKELNFKPITVLCGANSCGKSSIIQSLLLLKQTIECQRPNQFLLLNGRFVHLGAFDNIIYQKNPGEKLTFDFTFKLNKEDAARGRFPYFFFFRSEFAKKDDKDIIDIILNLKIVTKSEESSQMVKPIKVCKWILTTKIKTSKGMKAGPFIKLVLEDDEKYRLFFKISDKKNVNESCEKTGVIVKAKFANLFPVKIKEIKSKSTDPSDFANLELERVLLLRALSGIMENILSTLTYIGPLREEPSRRYIYEDEVVEVGVKGENAAYIYLSEQSTNIANHYFYEADSDGFIKENNILLSDAVRKWLNLMNIEEFNPEPQNEIIYLNLNAGDEKHTRVNIADVGFGVSQIFPIVLQGLRMPVGNTLILEQPEIHLHPKVQMQMADFFIGLAMSGKKVIIETHSDHVINRLVRRMVEDVEGKLKDLIGVYFVQQSKDGSTYEAVEIDDQKGIVNWPDGFFDQAAIEQEKIMMAGVNKRIHRNKTSKGND
ncbi:DUF3696 domain-containing protein [Anaeroarcus burkinensis]|uniref:DUF3696 domain-containing protein n=1 Tax=Anaeroarcus burkinensis TaxID=82376 RepID=UPI0004236073|nr:DUF3696 domain-containing protein [Anaeroarcus burkinensis]